MTPRPERKTKAEREEEAVKEMLDRGYVKKTAKNSWGEKLSGWWCDDVFLDPDPIQALREADGAG